MMGRIYVYTAVTPTLSLFVWIFSGNMRYKHSEQYPISFYHSLLYQILGVFRVRCESENTKNVVFVHIIWNKIKFLNELV